MDFRSYTKVCVLLGKSQIQMYADLHAASLSSAPSASTVFIRFSHFSGENSGLQDVISKMKNNRKCNKKLIVGVKAMVDEDARIAIIKKNILKKPKHLTFHRGVYCTS